MRVTWGVLALLAACRFDPSGGPGGDDPDGAVVDASDDDAANPAIDAAEIDAADARVTDPAIDAAVPPAIDARPACPAGYATTFNGSRYAFRAIAQQYLVGKQDCVDDLSGRTHLATFEIAADLDGAIAAINPGNNATVFVGAECNAVTSVGCTLDASWSWITGGVVASSLWGGGQPDDGTLSGVAMAQRDGGEWVLNDVARTLTRPYVCECDP